MIFVIEKAASQPDLMWVCDTSKIAHGNLPYRDNRLNIMYKGVMYDQNSNCYDYGKNRLTRPTKDKLTQTCTRDQAHSKMLAMLAGEEVPKPAEGDGPAASAAAEAESNAASFSAFEKILSESLAKATAEQVFDSIMPDLRKRVYEDIGVIPKRIIIETPEHTFETEGVTHNKFETVLKLVERGIPVFLTGPAGSGKNHVAADIARATNRPFHFNNALTSEYALTGFIDANGRLHETEFRRAWVNGGLWMGDEFDASTPEVAVKVNAALANGYAEFPDGTIKMHPNARIIVAGNTFGTGGDIEYTGRFQLDAATLDRFALVHVDYDKNIEVAIAYGDMELVDFIRDLRDAVTVSGIRYVVSYRALARLVAMKDVLSDEDIIRQCVLKNLDKDDTRIIHKNMKTIDNRFTKAIAAIAGV